MDRDIRATGIHRDVEPYIRAVRALGAEMITGTAEVCVHPGGEVVATTRSITLEAPFSPVTRIRLINLRTGRESILDCPANNDRCPRWSPDGKRLAFLSDHQEAGNYQLYISSKASLNRPKGTPLVDGCIEYLHWSPDGTRILLGVLDDGWRAVHVFDRKTETTALVSRRGFNYWEANWCGNDALVAVVSTSPDEGSRNQAHLLRHALADDPISTLFTPRHEIGLLAASPSGRRVALVETARNDRVLLSGALRVIQLPSGALKEIDTDNIEVTDVQWVSEWRLLFAGHRGSDTVIAERSLRTSKLTILWSGPRHALDAGHAPS